MSENVRAHVFIRGRVQGVAFRYNTKSSACEHDVKGFVRNKADGSVEAIFEGSKAKVDSLLLWCKKGPKMAVVKDVDVTWETFKGEFKDFDIRF